LWRSRHSLVQQNQRCRVDQSCKLDETGLTPSLRAALLANAMRTMPASNGYTLVHNYRVGEPGTDNSSHAESRGLAPLSPIADES
jgi:hypothetical protein